MKQILVAGANAIDLIGVSKAPLIESDSNIGHVSLAFGGVSRNVAENLILLGNRITFLTPFGDDHFSMMAQSDLTKKGIPLLKIRKQKCSQDSYLAIHDHNGTLKTAINDFSLAEAVTPHDLLPFLATIQEVDALVLDTNFSIDTLKWFIEAFQGKLIFVDGVSQTKVHRLKDFVSQLTLLKVNQAELESLAGNRPFNQAEYIKELLQKGLKEIVVSSGKHPITYTFGGSIQQLLVETPRKVVSSNGAGDALFSGIIHQYLRGKNMQEAVSFGLKLASLTMEVASAIHPEVSQYASK